ncbi:hypothetical protein PABG_11293 [Paracoccidioides brasiliensis Pb03]|nr:hypothetical protein PABG_11293 [Paracoccidioides brasiliensis Pb03]
MPGTLFSNLVKSRLQSRQVQQNPVRTIYAIVKEKIRVQPGVSGMFPRWSMFQYGYTGLEFTDENMQFVGKLFGQKAILAT